jgi:hypothetical protein
VNLNTMIRAFQVKFVIMMVVQLASRGRSESERASSVI